MEAEDRDLQPQAKECLGPPEAGETGRIIPQKLEREHGPTDSLITYFCIYNFERINFSWLVSSNVS